MSPAPLHGEVVFELQGNYLELLEMSVGEIKEMSVGRTVRPLMAIIFTVVCIGSNFFYVNGSLPER